MLASILNMSSGRCWSSEMYNPVPGVKEGIPSSNKYQGGFGVTLMTKVSSWLYRYCLLHHVTPTNAHLRPLTLLLLTNTLALLRHDARLVHESPLINIIFLLLLFFFIGMIALSAKFFNSCSANAAPCSWV